MKLKQSRRQFLGGLSVGILGSWIFQRFGRVSGIESNMSLEELLAIPDVKKWLSMLKRVEDKMYLDREKHLQNFKSLKNLPPEQFQDWIWSEIRNDYLNKNTILVDGWILSQTEVFVLNQLSH